MIGFEKCKWEHSCGYDLCMPEFCKEYEAVPMTNAEYIRSMTDADLSDFLVRLGGCADDASCGGCPFENSGAVCWMAEGIEKWLKQPFEGE